MTMNKTPPTLTLEVGQAKKHDRPAAPFHVKGRGRWALCSDKTFLEDLYTVPEVLYLSASTSCKHCSLAITERAAE